jgi:carbonic anhydrase/acetyltransferase-like protein (isoleucine patch superfamily)
MPIYQPGKDCLVGAGAVVTENKGFTDRSVISGSATKAARVLSEDNVARLRFGAGAYVQLGGQYKSEL